MNRLELRKEGDARVSIHSMNDFEDALLGPRGELDSWLECRNEEEVRLHIGKLMHLSVVDIEYKLDALRAKVEAAEQERDALRAALEKIADWNGAWGPYPETNEAWCAMALITAREAVPQKGIPA